MPSSGCEKSGPPKAGECSSGEIREFAYNNRATGDSEFLFILNEVTDRA